MRLHAYYYGFDATGVEAIDNIVSAVACAGKAFHHTEGWTEEAEPYQDSHRGSCPTAWIQNAAIDAADEVVRLRRVAQAAERFLEADDACEARPSIRSPRFAARCVAWDDLREALNALGPERPKDGGRDA